MNHSMTISKSGVKAQQRALDIIANNIANVSSQGFKARDVNFHSLIRNGVTADSALLTNDFSLGAGVRSQQGDLTTSQGTLIEGTNSLDLALTGEGYFAVENAAGELFLTRDGSFMINNLGQIVNSNGDYLVVDGQSPVTVETSASVIVDANGNLTSQVDGVLNPIGQLTLYRPTSSQSLEAVGNNYYRAAATDLTVMDNTNQIQSNQLEQSNVDLANEFTNMIVAQRAYDLNIRMAQTTDEIKMMTNQFS